MSIQTINLPNYHQNLKNAKSHTVTAGARPPSALGDLSTEPPVIIPPLNTNIIFDLEYYSTGTHPGLSDITQDQLPKNFNWRDSGKGLISSPANQMLCGSCWAEAAAGIISDNFIVSKLVTWKPDLSATWILMCHGQLKCQGGAPAKAFTDIAQSQKGIVTKHCIDYSWCATNQNCNGQATKHFESKNLSQLIPSGCTCYYPGDFYSYKIDPNPQTIAIGKQNITKDNIAITVKRHIIKKGPVLGGFLVFKNFMKGKHTTVNGGVYLEHADYDNMQNGKLIFSKDMTKTSNYVGSHAVAVIGWGVQKDVIIDNDGTKQHVPYWYCRNSWTEKWGGNGGYFKMAMYPFNKASQFDMEVQINTNSGLKLSGGLVAISVSKPPEKIPFSGQLMNAPNHLTQKADFYKSDSKNIPPPPPPPPPPPTPQPSPPPSPPEKKNRNGFKLKDGKVWALFISGIVILIILISMTGYLIGNKSYSHLLFLWSCVFLVSICIGLVIAGRKEIKHICD
jgi:hypothetical protein